jgi:hypothetical protein
MKTKTEYNSFLNSFALSDWIDEMYAKYGKHIVNVSISTYNMRGMTTFYCGFITILQSQEQINID